MRDNIFVSVNDQAQGIDNSFFLCKKKLPIPSGPAEMYLKKKKINKLPATVVAIAAAAAAAVAVAAAVVAAAITAAAGIVAVVVTTAAIPAPAAITIVSFGLRMPYKILVTI